MDYVLLAATILGAAGLCLVLPRERVSLARLGLLLGAMALAGFFLFLIRLIPAGSGEGPPFPFYLFAAVMIAGAVGVISQPRPVYAALYFVLITLAGAGMFVLLMAEFMAIVLIIIYAGAILVTYVFVIMLASQGSTGGNVVAPLYDRRAAASFVPVVVSFILVGAILQVLLPHDGRSIATVSNDPQVVNAAPRVYMARNLGVDPATGADVEVSTTQPAEKPVSSVQLLGISLYSQHALALELAGILLTIALVGAVVIARKNTSDEAATLGSGRLPTE